MVDRYFMGGTGILSARIDQFRMTVRVRDGQLVWVMMVKSKNVGA